MIGPTRIAAQTPHHRDAGQALAAHRSGIGELPARLRPDHPLVDQPALLERLVAGMTPVMARTEKVVGKTDRTAPERKAPIAVRDAAVEDRADFETVVPVVFVVVEQ